MFKPEFKPDQARFFRPYREEFALVSRIAGEMSSKRCFAFDPKRALLLAWCGVRDSDDAAEILLGEGSEKFYARFERALGDVQDAIQRIIDKYAREHKDRIDPIDEVGSCHNPALLFRMAAQGIDGHDHRLDRMSQLEACRKLAIGSQLLAIGAVDSYEQASADLTEIGFLVRERLFDRVDSRELRISFALNVEHPNYIHEETAIRVGEELGEVPQGAEARTQVLKCRQVSDGARTWYVQTHSRPKTRISAVIKLEKGRVLNDRRAIRHVVVAIGEGGGIRAAEACDIGDFVALCRRRLWHGELREESDDAPPNAHRSPRYVDEKILGRYVQPNREHFLPPVEHQVTCVRAHLEGEHATDTLNHDRYKGKAVREVILPNWWDPEWYGIEWGRAP